MTVKKLLFGVLWRLPWHNGNEYHYTLEDMRKYLGDPEGE